MQTSYYDGREDFRQIRDEGDLGSWMAKAMRDPKVRSATVHKPGSSCIFKGVEYVYHTSGKWRNQTTGSLVDTPAADPYHDMEST